MKRPRLSAPVAALAVVAIAACSGSDSDLDGVAERLTAYPHGSPFEMPDLALTATDGRAYNLKTETAGRFTLLFFGYTYCPDICPITMAVSNAALAKLDAEERSRVVSLFVSMDPLRDTPERLEEWLDAMESPALGLRGSAAEVEAVLNALGMAMPPTTNRRDVPGGTAEDYLVPHPASLFLITPDGLGRFTYLGERVTPQQMAADLRALMEVDWPAPSTDAGSPATPQVGQARIPAPPGGDRLSVYARIQGGSAPDRLVAITSDVAASGSLHEMRMVDGMVTMTPLEGIDIPAGVWVDLQPGDTHGMLEGLTGVPVVGDSVTLTLEFASGLRVTVVAAVVDPVDAVIR